MWFAELRQDGFVLRKHKRVLNAISVDISNPGHPCRAFEQCCGWRSFLTKPNKFFLDLGIGPKDGFAVIGGGRRESTAQLETKILCPESERHPVRLPACPRAGPQGGKEAAFAGQRTGELPLADLRDQPQHPIKIRFPGTIWSGDHVQLLKRNVDTAQRTIAGDLKFGERHENSRNELLDQCESATEGFAVIVADVLTPSRRRNSGPGSDRIRGLVISAVRVELFELPRNDSGEARMPAR